MLPVPTPERVRQVYDEFSRDNKLVEDTVRTLFAAFPLNTDPAQVLSKLVVLSQLYSARVLNKDAETLAIHIISSNIDPLLEEGSSEAVDRIWNCDGINHYYSFATKYCSWHRPNAYPMWDGNVEEALWSYKKKDGFYKFQRKALWDYESFREIVNAFRAFYKLDSFTFKSIDEYLWTVGADLIKR